MKLNKEAFREYDIRGTVGTDLSDEFAHLLGLAFGEAAREQSIKTVGIGYDCRLSSEGYAAALARGLNDAGIDTVLYGMGPTPQLYFAVYKDNLGGGIMVTGSHNPPDMNGFKLLLGKRTLAGQDIQDLFNRMNRLNGSAPTIQVKGTASEREVRSRYIDDLVQNGAAFVKRKLKVVVDAGNGVGGLVGPAVLRKLGHEVIELYCEPDGRFPNHHPDPTVMKNIQGLIAKVKETGADLGIGWDGDADRIGAVDEKGEVIFGDMLLLLYGREILKTEKNPTIIGDVKCSSRLFDDLNKRGATALMWKTGHSLIKAKLIETGGALAGEMSGHMFFKHRFFGFDDGLYAAVRLCEIASAASGPISKLLSDVPPMSSTPEIRIECPENVKFSVPDKVKAAMKQYECDTTDGVRIRFPNGWGLVRASNTQPVLVMRFEASSAQFLKEYRELVTHTLEGILGSKLVEGGH
jgi:phosphomannomutase/phosphoglucomutase